MIELLWGNSDNCTRYDNMQAVGNLIAWLTTTIAMNEENHSIKLNGYIVVNEDDASTISTLFICEKESQEKVLALLQEPPGEFKGKYIARIPSEEPTPVQIKVDDEDASDSKTDENG